MRELEAWACGGMSEARLWHLAPGQSITSEQAARVLETESEKPSRVLDQEDERRRPRRGGGSRSSALSGTLP